MKYWIALAFVIFTYTVCFAQDEYGVPDGQKLDTGDYIISPDYETKNPKWVAEHINSKTVKRVAKRDTEVFKVDKRIPEPFRTSDKNYKNSGYVRGHMGAARFHMDSEENLGNTFYYSNVCPQLQEFNNGIWKELETSIYVLASKGNDVWIITCPLYSKVIRTKTGLLVPSHFGKSILIKQANGTLSMRSWIIPHDGKLNGYDKYRVTTEKFQNTFKMDLWSKLEDGVEFKLESIK